MNSRNRDGWKSSDRRHTHGQGTNNRKRDDGTPKSPWPLEVPQKEGRNYSILFDKFSGKPLKDAKAGGLQAGWSKFEAKAGAGHVLDQLSASLKGCGHWVFDEHYELISPLSIGSGRSHPSGNGFLFDPVTNCPVVPGSSFKGAVQAWSRETGEWDKLKPLFGFPEEEQDLTGAEGELGGNSEVQETDASQVEAQEQGKGRAGDLIFFDLLPVSDWQVFIDSTTPHYGDYYQVNGLQGLLTAPNAPADWMSPNPNPFLSLAPGTKFRVLVASRKPGKDSLFDDVPGLIDGCLGSQGLGARHTHGYGLFEWVKDGVD